MANKTTCWKCGNETPQLTNCIHCGTSLLDWEKVKEDRTKRVQAEQAAETAEDHFAKRYEDMWNGLKLAHEGLVRFMAFQNLKGTFWPGLKRLSVPRGWKAIVYNLQGGVEKELPAGIYTASKTSLGADALSAFLDAFRGTHLSVFMCRMHDFSISFMVPEGPDGYREDPEHPEKKIKIPGPYSQLSNCHIRSAEGFIGGAYLTMIMRIEDPLRLLMTLGDSEVHPGVDSQSLIRKLAESLFDSSKTEDSSSHEFCADYLWKHIRSEFVQIISSAVANESVIEMRNSLEVRNRVLDAISSSMSNTLGRFGLKLVEVTSFRFLSPEHDMILRKEAMVAQEQAELDADKKAAQVRQEKRNITVIDSTGAADTKRKIEKVEVEAEADVSRTKIAEAEATRLRMAAAHGAVREVTDKNRTAEQARELEREAAKLHHGREQRALNFNQDVTEDQAKARLLVDKAKMMLEVKKQALEVQNMEQNAKVERYNKLLAAQNQRRIEYVQSIAAAGLPSDSILALQMADRPELAAAYAEAVRARSYEDRLALQKQFEEKLLTINTTDRAQVHALLTAGINQIGNVMAEAQKKQRPQVVAAGAKVYEVITDAPPASPPPPAETGPNP